MLIVVVNDIRIRVYIYIYIYVQIRNRRFMFNAKLILQKQLYCLSYLVGII